MNLCCRGCRQPCLPLPDVFWDRKDARFVQPRLEPDQDWILYPDQGPGQVAYHRRCLPPPN